MSSILGAHISDEALTVLELPEEDYLADVFRLWDCYTQEWIEPAAVLLRFESDDVLIWSDNEARQCKIGPVDAYHITNEDLFRLGFNAEDNPCLAWLHYYDDPICIGRYIRTKDLLFRFR